MLKIEKVSCCLKLSFLYTSINCCHLPFLPLRAVVAVIIW